MQTSNQRNRGYLNERTQPTTTLARDEGNSEPTLLPVWQRLPNTSFGIGMGLAGHAILWKVVGSSGIVRDKNSIGIGTVSFVFWACSLVISTLLLVCYVGSKCLFHRSMVHQELADGSRVHFFNMPHLILIMLSISVPESDNNPFSFVVDKEHMLGRQVCYSIGLVCQLVSTSAIYESWLFSESSNITCAKPQFLLSTVGWFLLAVLGALLDIERKWGISLPSFCLGIGLVMYFMVTISIFNRIHESPRDRGSPALFLLMAPPAAGVVAWDLIERENDTEEFAMGSQLLLGWCLGLVLLLFRLGPTILQRPPVLGTYWAYVFPLAALATAMVRYASAMGTRVSRVLAQVGVVLSTIAVVIVYFRMYLHAFMVLRGKAVWGDPLLSSNSKSSGQKTDVPLKSAVNEA